MHARVQIQEEYQRSSDVYQCSKGQFVDAMFDLCNAWNVASGFANTAISHLSTAIEQWEASV